MTATSLLVSSSVANPTTETPFGVRVQVTPTNATGYALVLDADGKTIMDLAINGGEPGGPDFLLDGGDRTTRLYRWPAGTHLAFVTFTGTGVFESSSGSAVITVTEATPVAETTNTSVAVATSTAPGVVRLTATVTPAAATGRVDFYNGVTLLGRRVVRSGSAVYSSLGAVGTPRAVFVGTGIYRDSTSP